MPTRPTTDQISFCISLVIIVLSLACIYIFATYARADEPCAIVKVHICDPDVAVGFAQWKNCSLEESIWMEDMRVTGTGTEIVTLEPGCWTITAWNQKNMAVVDWETGEFKHDVVYNFRVPRDCEGLTEDVP